LTDQESSNHSDPPATQTQPNWIVRRVQKVKRYFHERRAAKKQENSQDRSSRRTANATVAIAALTVAVLIVGGLQYITFDLQLKVMQGQLNEMKDEQRPWIYADFSSGGPIYRNQSGGLTFSIGFVFHNTGHLPATYISPDVEAYLSGADGKVGSSSARERQKRRCDKPIQQPEASDQIGTTAFPGQNVPFGAAVGISAEEIEATKREAWLKTTGKELEFLFPWVVGCIRYRSPDGEPHQTGIAFTIGMTKPGNFMSFALPLDPTGVDPGRIAIMPWIEGGTAYAN
jgi:hypothetical protein